MSTVCAQSSTSGARLLKRVNRGSNVPWRKRRVKELYCNFDGKCKRARTLSLFSPLTFELNRYSSSIVNQGAPCNRGGADDGKKSRARATATVEYHAFKCAMRLK